MEADPVPDPEPPTTEVPETGGAEEPGEPETDEEDPPAELPEMRIPGTAGKRRRETGGPPTR